MRPRRVDLGELRELVERHLAGSLAEQIRGQLTRWNSPAAKLERRRRRTSAWLTLWMVITAVAATFAIVGVLQPGLAAGFAQVLAGIVAAAIAAGVLAVRSGLHLQSIRREQRALQAGSTGPDALAPSVPHALPPRGSLAREPMQRLAEAERTLADLLRRVGMSGAAPGGGGTVPRASLDQAAATGAEAAAALRNVAAALHAVERAREHAPAPDRAALQEAITGMRARLDEGLEEYGTLIAAAGRLVAASSTGGPDREMLTDAADRLHGLAVALRELFPDRR
jgi:hypothetical protein